MANRYYQLNDGSVTEDSLEFRKHCMRLVDELIECGGEITLERRDAPLSILLAFDGPLPQPWPGFENVKITGDVTSPIFTDDELEEFAERKLENVYGNGTERAE